MSAPTAVDGRAVQEGLAWHVDPPSLANGTVTPLPVEHDRRDLTSSVAQLSRTYNELCTQAVDSFEIAAGLEAAGVNDRIARMVYNSASVFDLAETLFEMVPRRPIDLGMPADRWHRPFQRHLMRGLLYGLPGLLYAVAFETLHPGAGPVLLLFATIAACGVGQGISVVGNMLIGWGEHRAAMSLFRISLGAAGALLAVLILVGVLAPSLLAAAVLAGVQILYLVAATVLLVLHADRLLLLILSPGVLLAAAALLLPADVLRQPIVLALLTLCPLGAVWAAVTRLTANDAGAGRTLRSTLAGNATLRTMGALYLAYGAVNAGLVSFAVVDVLTRRDAVGSGAIVLMMLPLVASLGIVEWLVHLLRSRGAAVLHETTSAASFRSRVVSTLLLAVLGYAALLAGMVVVVVALYPGDETTGDRFLLGTMSYAVLGLVFLLETLLLSLGRHGLAVGLATTALVVDTVLRWPFMSQPAGSLEAMHLVVFTGLLVLLIPITASQYRSVGMHR